MSTLLIILANALLDSFLQAAAIAALLAVMQPLLGRCDARLRHAASIGCLLLMAGTIPVALYSAWAAPLETVALAERLASTPPAALWPTWLAAAWLCGCFLMTLRNVAGWVRLRRLVAEAGVKVEEVWRLRFDRLLRRAGLDGRVRLLLTSQLDVPATAGWWRPVVLLPAAMLTGLPVSHVEALILHELAHVRRHDYLLGLLQSLAEIVLFHHPAAWWVSHRIRLEREFCCDDQALAWLPEPLTHARALTALESLRAEFPAPALSAKGGPLMIRIRRIVNIPATERTWAPALLGLSLLAFVSLGLARDARAAKLESAWLPPAIAEWSEVLQEAGQAHGVDPGLLAVLTLVESGGQAEARSRTGAVGLLQVMPATAESIAKERGLPIPSEAELADPALNADFGAWYLARQLQSFRQRSDEPAGVELAAAAYNAGPNRVREWLAGDAALSEETILYRRLVSDLWRDLETDTSSAYDNWRARIRGRIARHAVSPLVETDVSHPYGVGKPVHAGIDLRAPKGTVVRATLAGSVVEVSRTGEALDGRGKLIILRHAGGLESRYHHLSDVAVKAGDRVRAGESIGAVGSTGRSTGPHLHFEVRDLGESVDPADFLPAEF
jgi:murein DD-endopeptidase MepM/ murein hydrolase activator NlpD/beta-lactamase regulating signal transducer with metallopeptidase domain